MQLHLDLVSKFGYTFAIIAQKNMLFGFRFGVGQKKKGLKLDHL